MIIKYINNIEFLNLKLGNVSLTILVRGLHIFIWTTLHIFYLYTFFLPQPFDSYFPFCSSSEQISFTY